MDEVVATAGRTVMDTPAELRAQADRLQAEAETLYLAAWRQERVTRGAATIGEPVPFTALLPTLASIRRRSGITQRQVADQMSVQQSTVSDLEAGVSSPQMRTVLRYAQALEVEVVVTVTTVDEG